MIQYFWRKTGCDDNLQGYDYILATEILQVAWMASLLVKKNDLY